MTWQWGGRDLRQVAWFGALCLAIGWNEATGVAHAAGRVGEESRLILPPSAVSSYLLAQATAAGDTGTATSATPGPNIPTLPETRVEATRAPAPTTPPVSPSAPTAAAAPLPDASAFNNLPSNPFDSPSNPNTASEATSAGPFYNSPFASPPALGYDAPTTTTGTLFNAPQLDVPLSLSVVTQQLVRDQQAVRNDEILRDISGAVKFSDSRRPDAFSMRGFEVRTRDFRKNGFLDPTPVPRDMANVERIEVLKGPSSILYGGGQPAGVINYLTKKPLRTLSHSGALQFGSYAFQRYTIDSTGPVGQSDKLFYRLNTAYEDTESFRDYYFNRRFFIAPVLTYAFSDDTSLTVEGEYLNDRRRFDTGTVALTMPGETFPTVGLLPISRFFNQPNDYQHYEESKVSVFLDHRFSDEWAMRAGIFTTWGEAPISSTVPVATGDFLRLPPGTLLRQRQDINVFSERYYSAILNLTGEFDTGSLHHRTVFGTELGWFDSNFRSDLSDIATVTGFAPPPFPPFPIISPTSPLNAFAPNYGGAVPPYTGFFDSDYSQSRYGFYAQDLIDIAPKLKAMAGVRYDLFNVTYSREYANPISLLPPGTDPSFPRTTTDTNYYRLTPRVGLVYQPIEEAVSVYATYSESFDPPPRGNYPNLQPLRPETGRLYEAGVKAQLLDNLQFQFAGFHILKENVTTQLSNFFATQVGEQQSTGLETSLTGNLTERWSVMANYAYIDSRINADSVPSRVGMRFRGIPLHSANLWTRYDVLQNDRQTLGAALGIVYVGERNGNLPDPLNPLFTLGDYTRWDAGLYYRRGMLNTSLYLENLFDREYYSGSVDQFTIFPGMPVNVRAQVGVTY